MVSPALSIRSLAKVYGSPRRHSGAGVAAVVDFSLDIAAGECFGLLGPNGAGKSTALNCITGFYPPTSGTVSIGGHDVHHEPKSARLLLGVCDQDDTLDTDFSLLDQLIRHATFFHIPREEARVRAERLLDRFELADKRDERVENLSGGMRRKLQVARAFIADPKVVVLDEPTTGLDPEARRTVWDALAEYRASGVAILLSTHYMEEAERLCDRIGVMHQGRLLDCDVPTSLIARHAGSEPVEEAIRPGVFWKRPPNLEDVFLRLTGDKLLSVKL